MSRKSSFKKEVYGFTVTMGTPLCVSSLCSARRPHCCCGCYSWFMQLTEDICLRGCLLFLHNSPSSSLGMCFYKEVSLGLDLLTSETRRSQWKKTNLLHHCFSNRLVRMNSFNCVLPFWAGWVCFLKDLSMPLFVWCWIPRAKWAFNKLVESKGRTTMNQEATTQTAKSFCVSVE